ncbi:uncharacterized protein LOC110620221 isoform X2 [Manihot esculenta]|uniref:Synergin gamma C-terminal domain-containing protein n=1 Tax=Manihot esculenta TaxID=3983 RepID=A0A2C9VFM6_MANES|nr:uncharacterized protein LOC110620221 isoform X2 [Manihot esculenta]OAY44089.1 hypothetical protein MANES_08G121600v8 [Manihot esculenta]
MVDDDDDDEGFGDFKSAPFSRTVLSNSITVNGRDSTVAANDDEDWGDFVNSSGLSHPKASNPLDAFGFSTDKKLENKDSESNQPASAPGRVNSGMVRWERLKGALPLSIFGDVDEDEESGVGDPSFGDGGASLFSSKNVDSMKKGSGLNVNDLVANSYKQIDHKNDCITDLNGSNSVDKTNKNDKNSDLNISSLKLGVAELSSNARPPDSSWNWVNSNANDLHENGTNGLKLNSKWLDLDWSLLNLNTHINNSNKDGKFSVTGEAKSSTNKANSVSAAENGRFDNGDNDGWGFKDSQAQTPMDDELSKVKQIKIENGLLPNLNGINPVLVAENREVVDDGDGDDEWEFKVADSKPQVEVDKKMPEKFEGALYTSSFGNGVHGISNFGFDFNSSYKNKENDIEKKLHYPQVDAKVGSDENSWAFKDAFPEAGSKDKEEHNIAEVSLAVEALVFNEVQGNKVRADNHKGALPLSLFGDEETEADDPVIDQDISAQFTSDQRVGVKNPYFNIPINDLISRLYSQAEQSTSVNREQSLSENGLDSTKTVMSSNLGNANHDFDYDSWEFQDASAGARAEDQFSVIGLQESHTKYSTKIELNDYVELFSKLKKELYYIALCHLENLKKTQSAAALIGEDAKVQALDREIQDLTNELHKDSISSGEAYSERRSQENISLHMFVKVLHEPKFQDLESECHLTKKLSLAESDFRSALELLKYVSFTLKVLSSVPREEQSSYISAWSKMLSVCAQELRHGAFIWKRSLQENVHDQILSKPQGKKYVLALGEIYRVVEVIRLSAELYKPWILASSTDSMGIFTLLSKCSLIWSSSGLEMALLGILNSPDFEYGESLKTILESIKYIHDLDSHTLYNHVVSGQGPICQLSALTAGMVPGMKTVVWNGQHCFLTLANLWANLVSSEPPNLPCIHVG